MYGVLQRKEQRSGDDHQERLMLSFDRMFGREQDGPLWALFDYWRSMKENHGFPLDSNFQPKHVLLSDIARCVCWMDVQQENPHNFVLHDHAGLTYGNYSDVRLGDYPSKMNMSAVATEYLKCKTGKIPMYSDIQQTIGGISRNYMRLMLPVTDSSGAITKVYYAVRLISLSESDRC